MSRIHLTHEPRGDRLTNRCITLVEEPKLLQFSAWRDEVKLDIRYHGKHKIQTTQHANGFEFDLILKERPHDNQFVYDMGATNLLFAKQPALTEEEIRHGSLLPENAINSYAIYHSHKRDNRKHRDGSEENYKCGKFGHLYRPKALDADGKWTWCDMNIEGGNLVIIVPESFLHSARYPVRIDPIIGFDEIGVTVDYPSCWNNDDYSKLFFNLPAPGLVSKNQILESISGYTWTYNNPGWPEDEDRFKMGVYTRGEHPDGLDYYFVAETATYPYPTYNDPQWHTKPITGNLIAGTTYIVVFQCYSENCGFLQGRIRWAKDPRPGGAPVSHSHDLGATFNWPNTPDWSSQGGGQSMWSLYVTYVDGPETDWVDDGNLLACVDAPVRLNTNHSMYSETGHEPKYVLDNDPNTYWKPDSTVDRTIYFNLGSNVQVDAFAFWIHNHNAGLGGSKAWELSYSTDDSSYTTFDRKLFTDSRNAGVPLIAFKFENPVSARYWKLELIDFDETPEGPVAEIGGVWFMRDYSLPYDNQYPEPQRFEWGNDIAMSRSGNSYQERRFRGHVRISNKEYVFVQQAHSDLPLNAYRASRGGLLPIVFKPDYDSVDWLLCRFTSQHSLNETWSEVFQPRIEIRELGFKRIPYTTKTLPPLSTTVGHWKFGESLTDSSGNNHTLTVVDIPGGTIYDYGICDHNKTCIVFDDDGLLNLDAAEAALLDMGTSDFSLELILATATVSETIHLIHKFGDSPSPPPSPEPSPSPLEAGYYVALTTAGKLNVCVGDGSNEVIGTDYGTGLDDGVFHCIAVTVDRTLDLLKVYIDGVQVGSNLDISSITGAITNTIEPFQIGGENLSGNPKCIIGLLDEACVSKQLLSATLIASRHAGYSHDGSWRL